MLDKSHIDIAGEKGELERAQFIEGPALPPATCGDGLIPDRRHFFA